MPPSITELVDRHRAACDGFTAVVQQGGDDRWNRPSPCPEWDARGVVEHVIGFHDVLLLRPLAAKPERPKDDTAARWALTHAALFATLDDVRSGDDAPGAEGADVDLPRLLPLLTTDVLAHTWDLARAIDVEVQLDPRLCEGALDAVQPNDEQLRSSGMFGPAVPVDEGADAATRLVAFLGRDPRWRPPTS